MLSVKNITKTYKSGELTQKALDGVSLNFRQNEFVSILGPSGSGKTTLLNIIGGLDTYDSGDLIINGTSTKKYKDKQWDAYRNHSIGFIFQSYNLIPHQSILSNVEMALTISGLNKKERRKKALNALEKVGLKEHRAKKPNQLSGGQMQRVAIARALVNNPDILLADEPTGALDSETGIQVMELLKEVAKDKLVVMVTHNPDLAETYSTRIIKISDGKVVEDTNPLNSTVIKLPEDHGKSKRKKSDKVSMGRFTAFLLSLKNLMTKKGRTTLTSIAGSIGLIGIALILSISDGVNLYIEAMQREAMASYPITITSTTVSTDFLEQMESFMPTTGGSVSSSSSVGVDYSSTQIGDTLMNNALKKNNLSAFKKYLDENSDKFDKYTNDTGIVYSYSLNFGLYTTDKNGKKVNMNIAPENSLSAANSISSIYSEDTINAITSIFGMSKDNIYSELLPDKNTLLTAPAVKDEYELLYGHWPENYNEFVLVLSSNSTLTTEQMCQLGLITSNEYQKIVEQIKTGKTPAGMSINYSAICNKEYTAIPLHTFYEKTDSGYIYKESKGFENGIPITISGVIKPREGANNAMIMTPIAYTAAFSDYIIRTAEESEIVYEQINNPEINILTGEPFNVTDKEKIDRAKDFVSLPNSEKQILFTKLMMAGLISIDMDSINYDEYFQMPEIDINSILYSMTNSLSDEEKVYKFNEFVDNLSESDLEMFMGSDSANKIELTDADKIALIDAYLSDISDEDLLSFIEQSGKMGIFSGILSDKTKIKLAHNYINNLTDKEKLSFFPEEAESMMAFDTDSLKTVLKSLPDSKKIEFYSMIQFLSEDGFDFSQITDKIDIPDISGNTEEMMSMYLDNWLKTASDSDLIKAYDNYASDSDYESTLKTLGVIDRENPESISFYVNSFEDKDAIQALIEEYNKNASEDEQIAYTDFISLLTSSLTGIIDAISYVLIAFVAVSLFVSSIMISVITSISVMERTKEIGILRSLGASKRNVVSIFKAETFIIGLLSGFIGITISYLALIPINYLADKLTGIDELRAVLKPEYALILIAISILITILGGWIPAKKAAKCDPVIALRSE